jgi:arginine N-succinyltransferase
MLPGQGNVFWDSYGRRVTGLSFREADILSTLDKEFIRALFPETPIYTFMLPDEVRNSLGAVGENTRGAVRLLEQAGMRYLNQIDPFDGGPYYGAATAELEPVRERRTAILEEGEAGAERHTYLVAVESGEGFSAVRTDCSISSNGKATVSRAVLNALQVRPRTRAEIVALP